MELLVTVLLILAFLLFLIAGTRRVAPNLDLIAFGLAAWVAAYAVQTVL